MIKPKTWNSRVLNESSSLRVTAKTQIEFLKETDEEVTEDSLDTTILEEKKKDERQLNKQFTMQGDHENLKDASPEKKNIKIRRMQTDNMQFLRAKKRENLRDDGDRHDSKSELKNLSLGNKTPSEHSIL